MNKIIHALIFAAGILAASVLMKGSENANMVLLLMVAGWIATGGLSGSKNEIACLKRKLSGKS